MTDPERIKTNCMRMQALGHAVLLSEIIEADGAVSFICHHYLTCVQCRRDRQAKYPDPLREQVIGRVTVTEAAGLKLLDYDSAYSPLEEAKVSAGFSEGSELEVVLREPEFEAKEVV